MLTPATFQFSASGSVRGVTTDVTQMVTWQVDLKGVMVLNGLATATAPGIYTITAKSGNFQASATLTATFSGDIFDPNFDQTNNNKTVLDGDARRARRT